MKLNSTAAAALAAVAFAAPAAAQTFFGPTPYLSTADSPFPLNSPSFVLENFEDHVLDAPGATISGGYITSTHFSGTIIDSVDADDGVIDGVCLNGDSYFSSSAVEVLFDANVLGALPKRVGIVWTDGPGGSNVVFEAFGPGNVSLGVVNAPNAGDGSNHGTTGEDPFFGVDFAGGVARIRITGSGANEVDHLQYELPCGVGPSSIYCTAKVNSLGCTPQIGYEGCPSASASNTFRIRCSNVITNKSGLLFYGYGPAAAPFQGGFMCVQSPVRRTPIQSSGVHAPPDDCSGSFSFQMNSWIQSGIDPLLVPGATVCAQFWSRDPASPSTTSLSDALSFTVRP